MTYVRKPILSFPLLTSKPARAGTFFFQVQANPMEVQWIAKNMIRSQLIPEKEIQIAAGRLKLLTRTVQTPPGFPVRFRWTRPVAVRYQPPQGEERKIRIIDPTRILQMAILLAGLFLSAIIQARMARRNLV